MTNMLFNINFSSSMTFSEKYFILGLLLQTSSMGMHHKEAGKQSPWETSFFKTQAATTSCEVHKVPIPLLSHPE